MTNVKTPIEVLDEKALKPKLLALPEKKEIPDEIEDIHQKYQDFGINNSTAKAIAEKKKELERKNILQKEDHTFQSTLSTLISMFNPYKVLDYQTVHNICSDYDLIISSLSAYEKPIALENIEELQSFKTLMGKYGKELSHLGDIFPRATDFSFDRKGEKRSIDFLDFSNYFLIAAPSSHFNFPKKQYMYRVGNEVKPWNKPPAFRYTPKIHVPTFQKDPIVLAPFMLKSKVYFAIVTAWDKEADDFRIRQSLQI